MSRTQVNSESAPMPDGAAPDMKLEVVLLPVADVDRAKQFYSGLGWRLDGDFAAGDDFRVVQLTPPSSQCSVVFGTGITAAQPGSVDGLQLVVPNVEEARAALVARGVDVSEPFHDAGGVFHHAGVEGRVSGPDPQRRSYGSFASFADPDGNGWILQEVGRRLPGRLDPDATRFASATDLAAALRRAEAAHGEHERRTGMPDADWPSWYAEYMAREQSGAPLPT